MFFEMEWSHYVCIGCVTRGCVHICQSNDSNSIKIPNAFALSKSIKFICFKKKGVSATCMSRFFFATILENSGNRKLLKLKKLEIVFPKIWTNSLNPYDKREYLPTYINICWSRPHHAWSAHCTSLGHKTWKLCLLIGSKHHIVPFSFFHFITI